LVLHSLSNFNPETIFDQASGGSDWWYAEAANPVRVI